MPPGKTEYLPEAQARAQAERHRRSVSRFRIAEPKQVGDQDRIPAVETLHPLTLSLQPCNTDDWVLRSEHAGELELHLTRWLHVLEHDHPTILEGSGYLFANR